MGDLDGGSVTSDAGALLLGQAGVAVGPVDRLAVCFKDHRDGRFVGHSVRTLVSQRVFGIALGYENLLDHDVLRGDPMMAVLAGKLRAKRQNCAPVAGKSTLNRLELGGLSPSGDSKIAAWVRVSVRRIKIAMDTNHPFQDEFRTARRRLSAAAA